MILRTSPAGSSPRVRGTRKLYYVCTSSLRFIPACAGNALSALVTVMSLAVHPRVCGERLNVFAAVSVRVGSSPRVRGTRGKSTNPLFFSRFIPACAGNADCARPLCHPLSVHPRVCGERVSQLDFIFNGCGSSPRVRGTLVTRFLSLVSGRFIPACAGNAQGFRSRQPQGTVHPRVCGER